MIQGMETTNTTTTSTALRQQAIAAQQEAHDSFQRCDTDGFISQAANDLTARRLNRQAQIEDENGMAKFLALFDTEGNWVPAKLIDNKFGGTSWMLLDNDGKATGDFISAEPVRRNTIAKKGYLEGWVLRPAVAKICGGGRGFSGMASCYVSAVPTTQSHEAPSHIITADRWSDAWDTK
jgi:hypothetical protein